MKKKAESVYQLINSAKWNSFCQKDMLLIGGHLGRQKDTSI